MRLLAGIFAIITMTNAHVRWTFPPARPIALDFIDNVRRQLPCGVSKPGTEKPLALVAGRKYTFTWQMAYAHHGGIRINLLDRNGQYVQTLVASNNTWEHADNKYKTSARVQLPRITCEQCTLQLVRQALEWGENYKFFSCADVSIAPAQLTVFSNGRRSLSAVDISRETDCVSDVDCGDGGICIDSGMTVAPRRRCYCPWGKFGKHCENSSPVDNNDACFNYAADRSRPMFDSSCYERIDLADNRALYYRTVNNGDEMELIMDFDIAEQWMAFGVRPSGITASCYARHATKPTPEPEGETKGEPEPEGEAEPHSEPEGEPEPEGEAEPHSEPEGEPEPEGEAETHSEREGEPETVGESYGSLHGMDCMDIYVGDVIDGRLWIGDHYTRDRSTPLRDEEYGGDDDLLAAYGRRVDGRTQIMLRREIRASESTDHSLEGALTLIWANGQIGEEYYKPHVLLYHDGNRGLLTNVELNSKTPPVIRSSNTGDRVNVPVICKLLPSLCFGSQ